MNFKFHFIMYRDLNATVFVVQAFLQYRFWYSSTRSRMYVVAYYLLFAMRNVSIIVKSKRIQIWFYCSALQCMIQQPIWFDLTTRSNVYKFSMDIVSINVYNQISSMAQLVRVSPVDCHEQNRSTEGCSKLKRSVDMTSSGKNGLNIKTNASPKWDRTRCPEE